MFLVCGVTVVASVWISLSVSTCVQCVWFLRASVYCLVVTYCLQQSGRWGSFRYRPASVEGSVVITVLGSPCISRDIVECISFVYHMWMCFYKYKRELGTVCCYRSRVPGGSHEVQPDFMRTDSELTDLLTHQLAYLVTYLLTYLLTHILSYLHT